MRVSSRHASRRFAAVAAALVATLLASCSGSSSGGGPQGGGGACSLPAAASLSVVQVTPADDATGVSVGTAVSLRFNTCVDPATVTATNFLLTQGASFIPRTVAYDAGTATVTIRPSASLGYGLLHMVAVGNVRGARGETLGGYGASFTTQATPDTVPPATTAAPAGGYYNATQNVALSCTDNAGGTGCVATYYTVDGTAPSTGSARYTGAIAIAESATLRFFSVDGEGNAESPKQEVYVIDKVPPTLTAGAPSGSGAPVTQVLTATFSEPMKVSTLTPATVTVDEGVTVTLSYASETNTLSITPTERLACNTLHTVAIGPGATDRAGNALVQPATFSFTTTTDCVEPATTASVAGGVYRAVQSVTLTCADAGGSGCARIVYTTDGSVPSFSPGNGTIVDASATGAIAIGTGDTVLRYFAEDAGGNREVLREQVYSISTTGFTFVATDEGLARGVGPIPTRFVPVKPGGRTSVFFRDVSNQRLYRGTDRGLLHSDVGEVWTSVPESFPSVLAVLAHGSKIFVGRSSGLLVSTDGGATFESRDLGGAGWVKSIASSGRHVYVATDSGVAVSADKGRTFVLRTQASGLGSNAVAGLVLDGGKLYAATSGGVSFSADGAQTFTNRTSGLGSTSVNAIAVSGSTVYAGTSGGLSVSDDGGQTFTVKATTAQGLGSSYVGTVVLAGTKLYLGTGDPSISAATSSFAVSENGGTSFTTPPLAPLTDTGLRVGAILAEGMTVRVGAYPAYYLSTDGGATFAPQDLRGALKRIAVSGTDLYLAVDDGSGHGGVAVSQDGGRSFRIRQREHGLAGANVKDVFAIGSNVYAATIGGIAISTNSGDAFTNRPTTGDAFADCVYASGTDVWACTPSNLQKSTSGGAFASVGVGTGSGRAIAVSGSNFYVATSSGLLDSSNGGSSFVPRGPAAGLENTLLDAVAVDSAGRVLAGSRAGGTNGFSVSSDAGDSFTPLATSLFPRGIHASGTTWYASVGSSGLYVSTDGGTTWTQRTLADGLPGAANAAWYMP